MGEPYNTLISSLCSFLHSPVTSSLLAPNILLITLFSYTPSLRSSLNVNDQVSHPYKTTGKITVLYILVFHPHAIAYLINSSRIHSQLAHITHWLRPEFHYRAGDRVHVPKFCVVYISASNKYSVYHHNCRSHFFYTPHPSRSLL